MANLQSREWGRDEIGACEADGVRERGLEAKMMGKESEEGTEVLW